MLREKKVGGRPVPPRPAPGLDVHTSSECRDYAKSVKNSVYAYQTNRWRRRYHMRSTRERSSRRSTFEKAYRCLAILSYDHPLCVDVSVETKWTLNVGIYAVLGLSCSESDYSDHKTAVGSGGRTEPDQDSGETQREGSRHFVSTIYQDH